jgi:hypothetical protein
MKVVKIIGEKIKTIAGRLIFGLVLASLVGGLSALPAFGEDFKRPAYSDRDRYERRDRDRYERRDRDRDAYNHRRVYRHYAPRDRVYAPPALIIEPPPPPPGIHIFFPPIIIR